jgi:hypothetical protein
MKRLGVAAFACLQIFALVAPAPAASTVATNIHDFSILKLKTPKKVTLAPGGSATKTVKILIQNLGGHAEIVPDLDTLNYLVKLYIYTSGTNCPVPTQVLQSTKQAFPLTIGLQKKLNVVYNVTFDCANDPAAGAADFSYYASIYHSHLAGPLDDVSYNDNCPRGPVPGDKGCGTKDPATHELGGIVATDVVVK